MFFNILECNMFSYRAGKLAVDFMRGTCDGLKNCSFFDWPLANPCPFTSGYANATYTCVTKKPEAQIMNPTFETGDQAELKFDYEKPVTVWGWEANASWPGVPTLDGLITLITGTLEPDAVGINIGNGTKVLGGNWLILGNSSRVVLVWQVRESWEGGGGRGMQTGGWRGGRETGGWLA